MNDALTSWVLQRVGCDDVLGSDALEDACGVCKGNNSECTTHRGLYAQDHGTKREWAVPGHRAAAQRVGATAGATRHAGKAAGLSGPTALTAALFPVCFGSLPFGLAAIARLHELEGGP